MNNKHLLYFWLILLGLGGIGGCAQKIAKQDGATPPSSAQTSQQEGDSQTKTATPEIASSPENTPGAAPNDGTQQSSNAAVVQSHGSQADNPPTAEETAAATKLLPLPPQEIVDMINALTKLHRVRYLSRTAQYDFFVGGRFDAKYDINNNRLIVTNAPANDKSTVTCEYSKNGEMISESNDIPSQQVEECNKLMNELTAFMER